MNTVVHNYNNNTCGHIYKIPLPTTEGRVTTGGDYAQDEGNYILNPGDTQDCLEVLVFSDQLFETEESFDVRLIGLIDDTGTPVASLEGVTLNPDLSRVVIEDSDRK